MKKYRVGDRKLNYVTGSKTYPKCEMDKKTCGTYIYHGILLRHKKR